MKYAIIIPDGAADAALEELGGKTPLAAADTPHMDWIARHGKCGSTRNIPRGMPCGSDVAILSVIGYDPRQYYTGRAPLEAAAQGIEVARDEWVFRCNLVTVVDGRMEDYCAGHISSKEGAALMAELNRVLAGPRVRFYPGVSYRHLMTFRGAADVRTFPPHDIMGERVADHLPAGKGADLLRTLIDRSRAVLADHEVNQVRRDLGENPATSIWLWGQGQAPHLPPFEELYGVRGAVVAAVDLVRGLARLVGWDVIHVDGATGYLDTNYAGKGAAAVAALADHDLVCVHVEAPDEAGHSGSAPDKVDAIEKVDRHVVGPVLERLRGSGQPWRILVLPDHPTPCAIRTHTDDAVPFAIAGTRVEAVVAEPFTEASAAASDLHISRGCDLMEYFLKVR